MTIRQRLRLSVAEDTTEQIVSEKGSAYLARSIILGFHESRSPTVPKTPLAACSNKGNVLEFG